MLLIRTSYRAVSSSVVHSLVRHQQQRTLSSTAVLLLRSRPGFTRKTKSELSPEENAAIDKQASSLVDASLEFLKPSKQDNAFLKPWSSSETFADLELSPHKRQSNLQNSNSPDHLHPGTGRDSHRSTTESLGDRDSERRGPKRQLKRNRGRASAKQRAAEQEQPDILSEEALDRTLAERRAEVEAVSGKDRDSSLAKALSGRTVKRLRRLESLVERFNPGSMAGDRSPRRIANPVLFICDVQEKFRTAIHEFQHVITTTQKLVRAAKIQNFPIFTTTQNAARLGDTVKEVAEMLPSESATVIDKTAFSMMVPELQDHLTKLCSPPTEKLSVVLVGIETHICVTQTTLDLLALGHRVYILADGVSSCNAGERPIALDRLAREGATVTTSESLLFELLGDAKSEHFKAISGLVKETKEETKKAVETFCRL